MSRSEVQLSLKQFPSVFFVATLVVICCLSIKDSYLRWAVMCHWSSLYTLYRCTKRPFQRPCFCFILH